MNQDASLDFDEAIESWVNTVPQNCIQSLMPCYGVIRIKDLYFAVTDLVEDYKQIPL